MSKTKRANCQVVTAQSVVFPSHGGKYLCFDNCMLLDLPDELLDRIEKFVFDIRAWRYVRKRSWDVGMIVRQARYSLRRRRARASNIRRINCAHCKQHCLTELTWGTVRVRWVPYCAAHADRALLDNLDMYCVGGLTVDGATMILPIT